jgi:hypothetical protein
VTAHQWRSGQEINQITADVNASLAALHLPKVWRLLAQRHQSPTTTKGITRMTKFFAVLAGVLALLLLGTTAQAKPAPAPQPYAPARRSSKRPRLRQTARPPSG